MEYVDGIIIIVGLYVILATSFNLIIGYGGLVSIAHPVFFALGAYTSAILTTRYGIAPALSVIPAMLLPALIAFLIARPILRLPELFS